MIPERQINALGLSFSDDNDYDYDLYYFVPSRSPYIVSPEDYEALERLEVRARGFSLHRRNTDREHAHHRVRDGHSSMTPSPRALLPRLVYPSSQSLPCTDPFPPGLVTLVFVGFGIRVSRR